MKESCFVWCFVSIWLFCFCFSFERLLGSFGSGCGPRAMEYILLFNGKSWFCTLVEMEKKSCGFRCEPLLWFSFPYSYCLVYGRKKTPCLSSQSEDNFVPPNHFPGISHENKPSLCTLGLVSALFCVCSPEAMLQLGWHVQGPPSLRGELGGAQCLACSA